jgi:mono/diheme cytochrome c family protein
MIHLPLLPLFHARPGLVPRLLAAFLIVAGAMIGGCQGSPVAPDDGGGGSTTANWGYGGFAERPGWPSDASAGSGGDGSSGMELPCDPPDAVMLPARSAVASTTAGAQKRVVFTRDLFNLFQSHCGGCHVDANLGGFDGQLIDFDNFPELITQDAVDLIQSDDEEKFMPKPVAGGKPWSERAEGDAVRQLAELLQLWLDAGSPEDLFFMEPEGGSSESPYLMSEERAENLTNLGNCLPDADWFGKEDERSVELDVAFEDMDALPQRLDQTDLFTLDHAELAYHGVVAFAPAYPLWSDDSGKIRQVRVPRGTSITYSAETGEFVIPANTRFYKTFLKKIVDEDGGVAWRKIETRLIVSRPDACQGETCEAQALFGTYAWNEQETEATLVQDPLRDGTPFRDHLLTYMIDEQQAAEAGDDPEVLESLSRHYAIPGGVRCVQCHMGSPSKSFVLGFTSLQVPRQPYVEEPDMFAPGDELLGHGVLEEDDPKADELTQLERMTELGVITGIEGVDDLPSLRERGPAPPRNGYELRAQGYILGNCASCHNPRGFPSIKHPELRQVLNFYPGLRGDTTGGIFEYPLETFSPRVQRGSQRDVPIPYISPSIWDVYVDVTKSFNYLYTSKCQPTGMAQPACVEAPWRSFIYRNVDAPFTYADDYAIFPHMPRHGSGFDCRAPRLMGDWMVSIPAMRKKPGVAEELDTEPQPYKTVPPGDGHYTFALQQARARLAAYQAGERYSYCPDTSDIQDPEVLTGQAIIPRDKGYYLPDQPFTPWMDGVPDRAHWVVLDTTDVPGDWTPRRADWADVLLGDPSDIVDEAEREVVEVLQTEVPHVTEEFASYVLEEVPFGFWQPDSACDAVLSDLPTLADLPGDELPRWAKENIAPTQMQDPLYMLSPGAAVFSNICRNCHGPAGNGDSALAGTIQEVTGGATRVANLRDGLFGLHDDAPGGVGRSLVFAEQADDLGVDVDDLAQRYLLWMALGGTAVEIPKMVLGFVQRSPVLGVPRRGDPTIASANMLATAQNLCLATLPEDTGSFNPLLGPTYDLGASNPLIFSHGDAEMWTGLCAKGQTGPVRVIDNNWTELNWQDITLQSFRIALSSGGVRELIDPVAYGDAPVMTLGGLSLGVPEGEAVSWCIRKPTDPAKLQTATDYFANQPVEGEIVPFCPEEELLLWTTTRMEEFALHGAMNAGLAVFVYLDAIAKGASPKPQYDECRALLE